METTHRIIEGSSWEMDELDDESVELVVTSPPYPMIEMWDDLFCELDPAVASALDNEEGPEACERMHDVLAKTWREVERVLVDGGIACINIGDATRRVGDHFRVYQNHAKVIEAFVDLGFDPLPEILWRKPVNSAAKFMGSGMLPPNAYPTLEHEYLLLFRKGPQPRAFEAGLDRRYEAAYFWEERNEWFSDVWTDITGIEQDLDRPGLRERSGAFPVAIPYRVINMFSIYGETVLDPFWGTGTSTLAAMLAGRNSVGYELDGTLHAIFEDRVEAIPDASLALTRQRLQAHRSFVAERDAGDLQYETTYYDFPVMTAQEQDIKVYLVESIESTETGYRVDHRIAPGSLGKD